MISIIYCKCKVIISIKVFWDLLVRDYDKIRGGGYFLLFVFVRGINGWKYI